jgi:hypothetical protein
MLSLHSRSISTLQKRNESNERCRRVGQMQCGLPVSRLQNRLEHESNEDHSVADGLGSALAVDHGAAHNGERGGGGGGGWWLRVTLVQRRGCRAENLSARFRQPPPAATIRCSPPPPPPPPPCPACPACHLPFAAVVMIRRLSLVNALLSDSSPQHPLQSICRCWWHLQTVCVHIKWNCLGCTANHSRHSRNASAAGRKHPRAAASSALFWREASDVAYAMIRSAFRAKQTLHPLWLVT